MGFGLIITISITAILTLTVMAMFSAGSKADEEMLKDFVNINNDESRI